MKTRNKVILSSLVAIFAAASVLVGTTYALFSGANENNITVSSGVVGINSTIKNVKAYSGLWDQVEEDYVDEEKTVTNNTGTFTNGGTVTLTNDGTLSLDRISPMDKVTFDIAIENLSDIAAQYQVTTTLLGDIDLFAALEVTFDGVKYLGFTNSSNWEAMEVGFTKDIHVEVSLPDSENVNAVQGKAIQIKFAVEAIQGNAHTETVDDTLTPLYNENDLRLFANYVNKGLMDNAHAVLMNDVDLHNVEWNQIDGAGRYITFDGQGHTINNLKISDGHNAGFFKTGANCEIKNVVFDHASVTGIGRAAVCCGHGLCVEVENVTVKNSSVKTVVTDGDDGDKAGLVVGYLSGESIAYVKNCTVEDCTVEGYRDVGAIVGYAGGTYEVTGNTAKNIAITNNRGENYKHYVEDNEYDVHEIIGEVGIYGHAENNSFENVNISRLYYAANDSQLDAILADINATESLWNIPLTINLAPTTFVAKHTIRQFPTWDGSQDSNNSCCHSGELNDDAPTTLITLVGVEGTIFTNQIEIDGFGYVNGSNPECPVERVCTVIKGISFVQPAKDMAPIAGLYAATNMYVKDCTFDTTERISLGVGGNSTYTFTIEDCVFSNCAGVLGGYSRGPVYAKNVRATGLTSGFANIENTSGVTYNFEGCYAEGVKYGIRTNAKATVNVKDCEFNMHGDNVEQFIRVRGDNVVITLENVTLTEGSCNTIKFDGSYPNSYIHLVGTTPAQAFYTLVGDVHFN